MQAISDDTKVTLLMCGEFPGEREYSQKPLSLSEYNKIVKWLVNNRMRPADLLRIIDLSFVEKFGIAESRLKYLFGRGVSAAISIERWNSFGLWVVGRGDPAYPRKLKERLGFDAPAIIYGVGNQSLMSKGGVAIVGSRDATPETLSFTSKFAKICAKNAIAVISGGARGVDREAMFAAAECDGHVVGILADSLEKEALSSKYRNELISQRMSLISPFAPHARFHVSTAMRRNRYLYCLADFALVASSDFQRGGTWAGAVENLKHRWVPLLVRAGDEIPRGNRELINDGATPLGEEILNQPFNPRELIHHLSGSPRDGNTPLFE